MHRSFRSRRFAALVALTLLGGGVGALVPQATQAQVAPTFGQSILLRCEAVTGFNCGSNTEPDIKIDPAGNAYVSAQAGVPAGANLYKRPAGDTKFHFMGMPDSLPAGLTPATGLAPGGGDTSIAVAPVANATGVHNLYFSSLSAASVTLATSRDGGNTFETNYVASAPVLGVDRQWIAADGAETVFLMYRDFAAKVLWIQKSTDAGRTFGPAVPMVTDPEVALIATNAAGSSSRFSNLHVDPVSGNLYLVFVNKATTEESVGLDSSQRRRAWLARCTPLLICSTHDIYTDPSPNTRLDAVFPWVGTDAAGTVYAGWTTTAGVFVAHSNDQGNNWSAPVRVDTSQAPPGKQWSTVFPALVGGSAGRVGVAYLAAATTSAGTDDETAFWDVYYSLSTDGGQTWTQVKASSEPAHKGSICLRGLSCDVGTQPGNRDLAEVVTIAVDVDGMPIIAYPADLKDGVELGPGFSALVKQMDGDRLLAGVTTPPTPIEDTGGPPVFGPVVPTTLHFDSESSVANVDTTRTFLTGQPDPTLSPDAPTGTEDKVQSLGSSRLGNRRFGANFLMAYFTTGKPVKVQGSPTVDVWLSATGDGSLVPLRLGVQLFTARGVTNDDSHILYDGDPSTPATKEPLVFQVAVGPTPTKVTLALPAIDVEANTLILQFSSQRATADATKAETAVIHYGSSVHDSTFSAPLAFAT